MCPQKSSSIEETMAKTEAEKTNQPQVTVFGRSGNIWSDVLNSGRSSPNQRGLVSAVDHMLKLRFLMHFEYTSRATMFIHFLAASDATIEHRYEPFIPDYCQSK
jgi:hypothetical protein